MTTALLESATADSVSDCEHLTGRMRDICMGISGLPRDTENKYRALPQFGSLPPLPDNVPSRHPDHKARGGGVKISGTGGGTPVEQGERNEQKPRCKGVGDHFHEIVKSLGIRPKEDAGCGCKHTKSKLNAMTPQQCRDDLQGICDEIANRTKHYSAREKFIAATKAVTTGLAMEGFINPLDPVPGLLRIAINRAEAAACGP